MKEKTDSMTTIEYYHKLSRFCMIENCINLICFTTLAIIFKTWWIVFFALLFTTSIEKEKKDE